MAGARLYRSGEPLVRGASGTLEAALGLRRGRGSGSASGEGAFRGGGVPGRGEVRTVSALRRGQVRDTLYPLERQVAPRAAAP